jgi:hypothetical protein
MWLALDSFLPLHPAQTNGLFPWVAYCIVRYDQHKLSGLQGNCLGPTPTGDPTSPLAPLHPGQCVLSVNKALFEWSGYAAPLVWLHGLYIYSPEIHLHTLVRWYPNSSPPLYLSHVTLHGGFWGVYALKPAYLAGVRLARMPSAPGLCFWLNCT